MLQTTQLSEHRQQDEEEDGGGDDSTKQEWQEHEKTKIVSNRCYLHVRYNNSYNIVGGSSECGCGWNESQTDRTQWNKEQEKK